LLFLYGLVLFFCLLFLGCAIIPTDSVFYIKMNNRLLISVIGILCYFILNLTGRKQKLIFGWYDVFFLCFISLTFLSQFWARNPAEAVSVTFSWLFFYCVFKFVQDWNSNARNHKYFPLFILSILFLNLGVLLYHFLSDGISLDAVSLQFSKQQINELRSTFNLHKNYIASYLVVLSSISWYYLSKDKQKHQLFLGLGMLFLVYFSLLLIRSRGGVLTFVCLFLLFVLHSIWKKHHNWMLYVAILVLGFSTFEFIRFFQQNEHEYLFLMDPFYGVKSDLGDDRLHLWKISFQLFLEKPFFGFGSGSWMYEYMKYGVGDFSQINYTNTYFKTAHNVFVNVLFCNGIIGFCLFLYLILFYPIHNFYKNTINQTTQNINRQISLIGLLSLVIMMQFYGNFDIRANLIGGAPLMLFIFLGLLIKDKTLINWKMNNLFISLISLSLILNALCTKANMSNWTAFKRLLNNKKYEACKNVLKNFDENKFDFSYVGYTENYLNYQLMTKLHCRNEAIVHLEKHLTFHPYNFIHWYQLGMEYKRLNFLNNAINCFEKALLYNCDYINAKVRLYCIHTSLGNTEEANLYKNEFYEMENYLKQYHKNEGEWKNYPKAVRKKEHYQWQFFMIKKCHQDQKM